MRRKFPVYLIVFIVSLLADWMVQLSYFFIRTWHNPNAFDGLRTLFNYQTGVIGDFLILPIVNCLILFVVLELKVKFSWLKLLLVAFLGVTGDFFVHYMQGILKLTNWSMPEPFQWNFISYWHMISFFFQWSYIVYFLFVFFNSSKIFQRRSLRVASVGIWILLVLFVVLFLHDYNWLFGI